MASLLGESSTWLLDAGLSSSQPCDRRGKTPSSPTMLPRRTLGKYSDWLTLGPTTAVQGIMCRLSQLSQTPTPQINYPGGFRDCGGAGSHWICIYHPGKIKSYTLSNVYSSWIYYIFRAINSKSFPSKCKYFEYFNDCFPKPTSKIAPQRVCANVHAHKQMVVGILEL